MAHVIKDDELKAVKNLGWLLRHWKWVARFALVKIGPNSIKAISTQDSGVILIAYNWDSEPIYIITWASFNVCVDWLHRPIFRGLPLVIWYEYEQNWIKAEWRA